MVGTLSIVPIVHLLDDRLPIYDTAKNGMHDVYSPLSNGVSSASKAGIAPYQTNTTWQRASQLCDVIGGELTRTANLQ